MRLLPLCLFLLLNLSTTSAWADEADGKSFSVTGEQVNHQIPEGWKLAWMSGNPDGRYFAEYIPSEEDIKTWRAGYLVIERIPMPSATLLEEIKKQNASLPEVLLHLFIDQAASSCGGKHEAMSRRVNFFNEIQFAVSGGFCEKYGAMAPYGEGAFCCLNARSRPYFSDSICMAAKIRY